MYDMYDISDRKKVNKSIENPKNFDFRFPF